MHYADNIGRAVLAHAECGGLVAHAKPSDSGFKTYLLWVVSPPGTNKETLGPIQLFR